MLNEQRIGTGEMKRNKSENERKNKSVFKIGVIERHAKIENIAQK